MADASVYTFDMTSPQLRMRMLSYGVVSGAAQVEEVTAPAVAGATQGDFIIIYNQAGQSEALWLDIDADGTAPTADAFTATDVQTKVSVATGDDAQTVASAIVAAATIADVTFGTPVAGVFTVTQDIYGACADAVPLNEDGSGSGSIAVTVVTDGLTVSMGNGKFDGTITQTVAGTYVLVFKQAFLRAPEVGVTCKSDNRIARVTACTVTGCTIETQNVVGGATADSDFSLIVLGSDNPDFI